MNPTAEFNGEIQWRTPTARTIDVPDRRVLVDCSGCVCRGWSLGGTVTRSLGFQTGNTCGCRARISLRNSGSKSGQASKSVVAEAWARSKMVATDQIARFASAALVSLGKLSRTPRYQFTPFPATWISVDEIQRAKFGLLVSQIPPRWKGLCAIYAHAASAP